MNYISHKLIEECERCVSTILEFIYRNVPQEEIEEIINDLKSKFGSIVIYNEFENSYQIHHSWPTRETIIIKYHREVNVYDKYKNYCGIVYYLK